MIVRRDHIWAESERGPVQALGVVRREWKQRGTGCRGVVAFRFPLLDSIIETVLKALEGCQPFGFVAQRTTGDGLCLDFRHLHNLSVRFICKRATAH